MKLTKLIALLLVVALAALAVSCGGGGAAPAAASSAAVGLHGSPDEEYHMTMFVSGVEYWFPVYAAFKEMGNLLGVKTFYTGTPEYDVNKSLEVFEQILARNPKGILTCPITPESFKEAIDRAVDQGVAIITYATDSPDSKRQGFITSDNTTEGTFAARAIANAIGGKGKVMLTRNPGQLNHDIRCDTFVSVMKAEFPGVQIVAEEPTNQDVQKAYNAVMTVAQKHPDLAGFFSPEATSAAGASQAAKELGGGKVNIKILTCDVNEQILDQIKAGELWGSLNPDQGMQGGFGMLMLFMAAHPELINPMAGPTRGNPVNIPKVDNGLTVVTADNADYFYVDKYAAKLGYKSVEDMLSPGVPK